MKASMSRRTFLIRSAAVAGGAAALPLLGQTPARCSPRVASSPADARPTPSNVSANDVKAVTDNILCEGGCGKTVYTGELTDACPIATQMKGEAVAYLAQGMTPPQVLDQFVADFGEGVLAAPTRSGFNLLAWLVPFAALGLGGASIAAAVTGWRHAQPSATAPAPETDAATLSRIDEEVNGDL
jgi:cytochrome c-type biogenesis protein CcmH